MDSMCSWSVVTNAGTLSWNGTRDLRILEDHDQIDKAVSEVVTHVVDEKEEIYDEDDKNDHLYWVCLVCCQSLHRLDEENYLMLCQTLV